MRSHTCTPRSVKIAFTKTMRRAVQDILGCGHGSFYFFYISSISNIFQKQPYRLCRRVCICSAKDPSILCRRALHALQKSPTYTAKKYYILCKRALYAEFFERQNEELDIGVFARVCLCKIYVHVCIFSCVFISTPKHTSTPVREDRMCLQLGGWTGLFAKKPYILCKTALYSLQTALQCVFLTCLFLQKIAKDSCIHGKRALQRA